MASSTLQRRLLAAVLGSFLIPVLLTGVVLLAVDRAGLSLGVPTSVVVVLWTGLVVTGVAVGLAAHTVGRSTVRTLKEVQLGTELMATVNPDHRLATGGRGGLGSLAAEINRLADHLQEARTGLAGEVARVTGELETERGKLSSVLEALGEGVVLVTVEGRVSLANRAAQELLGTSLLGRSLFDFVDREKVAHFLERVRDDAGRVERFTLHPAGDLVLQAVMTPFFEAGGPGEIRAVIGFILVLRDVTATARAEEERRRLLADTVQELRNPLASIRSLSESLLADPALATGPDSQASPALPLLEAIHAEAVRLSGRVKEMESPTRSGLAGPRWHLEEIAIADLAAMTLRRLNSPESGAAGVDSGEVELQFSDPGRAARIRAEATALSGALARLLRDLVARRAPGGRAWLRPELRGRLLQIEAGAAGRAPVAELEALLDEWQAGQDRGSPASAIGAAPAQPPTIREVVHQHAGEVWTYADEAGFGYRVTLPLALPEEAVPIVGEGASRPRVLVGVGTYSGWEDRARRIAKQDGTSGRGHPGRRDPSRPYYDFSLIEDLERPLPAPDRDRPLRELTYVVFDTETTGLRPEAGDRVVSIAGVKVRGGAVKRGETFDALVNPGRRIPGESVAFHGITDAMVADAPTMAVVLPAFLRFVDGAVPVADQAWFDLRCLVLEARRLGLPLELTHPPLDTVQLSEVVHGPLAKHWLDATATRLGVAVQGRHSALGDALATAEVFIRLVELLEKRGIRTLGQAVDAARERQSSR